MLDPFARRWTDAQRAAIVTAVLDHGRRLQETRDAAAAGELGGEPFDIPYRTAWGYVRAERRRRENERSRIERLGELFDRGVTHIDAEFDRLEASIEAGDDPDMRRFIHLCKATRHLLVLDRQLQASRPVPRGEGPATQAKTEPKGLVQRLAHEARGGGANEPPRPEHTEPEPDDLDARGRGGPQARVEAWRRSQRSGTQGPDAARLEAAQHLLGPTRAADDAPQTGFL